MFHNIADHRLNIAEPVQARTRPDAATEAAVLADVLTLVGTAQMVQQILREAFPATAFALSVTENVRGTQLTIRWTDGPRDLQVARIVMPLQATRLVDGGKVERVEHFMLTPTGRQVVSLAADRIALCREFSDGAIERALARLASRYADYLAPDICAS
ncbi:LPD29 domain-containing protein [Burkholderia ubonensis]|uniref:LPD29 domain-containing protein n=1 Tax=Burkholderia ubonensis TaxID=101571 RepID=UPI000AF48AA0|nr:LPD29 domain-containing protein [Burkholderia ubonensis]